MVRYEIAIGVNVFVQRKKWPGLADSSPGEGAPLPGGPLPFLDNLSRFHYPTFRLQECRARLIHEVSRMVRA
jgi:hypothetical protein